MALGLAVWSLVKILQDGVTVPQAVLLAASLLAAAVLIADRRSGGVRVGTEGISGGTLGARELTWDDVASLHWRRRGDDTDTWELTAEGVDGASIEVLPLVTDPARATAIGDRIRQAAEAGLIPRTILEMENS